MATTKKEQAADQKFEYDFGLWGFYNDPHYQPQTAKEIRAYYRKTPYIPPQTQKPPLIPPLVRPFPLPITRPNIEPPTPEEEILLSAIPPSLPLPLTNWKGVKVLGAGTSGSVVMFQHSSHGTVQVYFNILNNPNNPNPNESQAPPFPTQIAVKTISKPAFSNGIEREVKHLKKLGESGSAHVVRLLGGPIKADLKKEGLGYAWKGISRRLVLEYCPGGTLLGLLSRRRDRNLPLKELTLWRIFECLVDGCSVLQYGQELSFDDTFMVAREPFASAPKFRDELVVHHDFKPENIFAGERNRTHEYTPVYKIGDFGLAQAWPTDPALQVPKRTEPDNQYYRQIGTPGFYSPEQFTPRWNYSDWKTSGVAGVYGSHTNVWGIGCCMYELLTLLTGSNYDELVPDPQRPFLPCGPIHDNPPKGLAYGTSLPSHEAHSRLLRDTVQECLYEHPRHRPSLLELKTRVTNAINGIVSVDGPGGEPWEDMEMPEPLKEISAKELAQAAVIKQASQNVKDLARIRIRSPIRPRSRSRTSAGPSQAQAQKRAGGARGRSASPSRSSRPLVPAAPTGAVGKWRCTYYIERKGKVCEGRRRAPKEKRFRCYEHLDRVRYPDQN